MSVYEIPVTTVGNNGAATGSAEMDAGALFSNANRVPFLAALKVVYDEDAPNTTDVVISEAGGLGRTLLTLSNNNTSGTYYPRYPTHDSGGAAGEASDMIALTSAIKVEVAECDALDPAVTVSVQLLVSRALD